MRRRLGIAVTFEGEDVHGHAALTDNGVVAGWRQVLVEAGPEDQLPEAARQRRVGQVLIETKSKGQALETARERAPLQPLVKAEPQSQALEAARQRHVDEGADAAQNR